MTIEQIISKDGNEYSQQEILFVITEYIKERKGVEVTINPPNNTVRLVMMKDLFNSAMDWFIQNKER